MSSTITMILPLVVLLVVMYFLIIRPQKKREKQINEMRQGLKVGDEIVTIGGICGKIVKTKEDSLIIQVGADRVKFEITKWAVSRVVVEDNSNNNKPAAKDNEEAEETKKAKPKRLKKAAAAEEVEEVAETTETKEQ